MNVDTWELSEVVLHVFTWREKFTQSEILEIRNNGYSHNIDCDRIMRLYGFFEENIHNHFYLEIRLRGKRTINHCYEGSGSEIHKYVKMEIHNVCESKDCDQFFATK